MVFAQIFSSYVFLCSSFYSSSPFPIPLSSSFPSLFFPLSFHFLFSPLLFSFLLFILFLLLVLFFYFSYLSKYIFSPLFLYFHDTTRHLSTLCNLSCSTPVTTGMVSILKSLLNGFLTDFPLFL